MSNAHCPWYWYTLELTGNVLPWLHSWKCVTSLPWCCYVWGVGRASGGPLIGQHDAEWTKARDYKSFMKTAWTKFPWDYKIINLSTSCVSTKAMEVLKRKYVGQVTVNAIPWPQRWMDGNNVQNDDENGLLSCEIYSSSRRLHSAHLLVEDIPVPIFDVRNCNIKSQPHWEIC